MTTNFFHPSILLLFLDPGSEIRDPGWVNCFFVFFVQRITGIPPPPPVSLIIVYNLERLKFYNH
jgi:hypothetical protein